MVLNKNFRFFAAANGYSGFRSYFNEVFNPEEYTKLYILKGGPGTGKSTLMKSIYSHFSSEDKRVEAILCSSDPDSLDGVIIGSECAKIAVIDGTAPHERDTVFPGAVDEIINLGGGWDSRLLEAERDRIIPLVKEKKSAYKAAYRYLAAAGEAKKAKEVLENGVFDIKSAKNKAKYVAERLIVTETPRHATRLISAFGKNGSVRLDTLNKLSKHTVGISVAPRASAEFLRLLWSETKDKANAIRIPTPLDDAITEAIFYPDSRLTVAIDNSSEETIFVDEFFKVETVNKARSEIFSDSCTEYSKEAARWFKIAADLHFRLEEIYSVAMNFDQNEKIKKELIDKISKKISP